jgi:hypothetical protein
LEVFTIGVLGVLLRLKAHLNKGVTMFEKEAEEYTNKLLEDWELYDPEALQEAYIAGAEFGYNKANEWHYVKDGDLPKGEGAVLIYWKSGDIKCASVVEPYKVTEDTHIIAWKEIALPELKESE